MTTEHAKDMKRVVDLHNEAYIANEAVFKENIEFKCCLFFFSNSLKVSSQAESLQTNDKDGQPLVYYQDSNSED